MSGAIWQAVKDAQKKYEGGIIPNEDNNITYLCFVSMAILNAAIGERAQKWMGKYIIRGESGFLGSPESSAEPFRLQSRMFSLAEMIYNLRDVEGLQSVTDKIIAVESGDSYEVAYSELEAARILKSCGAKFSFKNRVGKKGDDYDFDVSIGGVNVPCEAKCKIERNVLAESSIYNTLHKASGQFSKCLSYWIIMKLPIGWDKVDGEPINLDDIIKRAYENHERLQAIVFHWEISDEIRGGGCSWRFGIKVNVRREAQVNIPQLGILLTRMMAVKEYEWVNLPELLGVHHERKWTAVDEHEIERR